MTEHEDEAEQVDRLLVIAEHLDPRQDLSAYTAIRLIDAIAAMKISVQVVCGSCPIWARPSGVEMEDALPAKLPVIGLIRWHGRARAAAAEAKSRGISVLSLTPLIRGDVSLLMNGTEQQQIAIQADPVGQGLGSIMRRAFATAKIENTCRLLAERKALSIARRNTKQPQPSLADHARPVVFQGCPVEPFEWFGYDQPEQVARVPSSVPNWGYSPEQLEHWRATLRRGAGIDEQTPVVLFPSARPLIHGFGPLMLALRKLVDQGHSLVVLLAGRYRYTHLSWIAELGVRDRVRFMGPTQHLDALYAASDAVAHPTYHDMVGEAVLRAIAAGKPVMTTRACFPAEAWEASSLVLKKNPTPAEIASAIDQVLTRPAPSAANLVSPRVQAGAILQLLAKNA